MYSRVGAAAADDDADVVVNVELVADALGVATPECEAIEVLLKYSGFLKNWYEEPGKIKKELTSNFDCFYLASQDSR